MFGFLLYAETPGGIGQLPPDGIDGTSGCGANESTGAGVTIVCQHYQQRLLLVQAQL